MAFLCLTPFSLRRTPPGQWLWCREWQPCVSNRNLLSVHPASHRWREHHSLVFHRQWALCRCSRKLHFPSWGYECFSSDPLLSLRPTVSRKRPSAVWNELLWAGHRVLVFILRRKSGLLGTPRGALKWVSIYGTAPQRAWGAAWAWSSVIMKEFCRPFNISRPSF